MKKIIFILFLLLSTLTFAAEFKAGEEYCFKYYPKKKPYFQQIVKSVSEKEIVLTSELIDSGKKITPHEEKYTPKELSDFRGRITEVDCSGNSIKPWYKFW